MVVAEKIKAKWIGFNELLASAPTRPALEIVYRDLFLRDLKKLGLEDIYYPVNSAANHSLLYLITRCFLEFPIVNGIELGAGQSSILISQLSARLNRTSNIRTVEHDQEWATKIQAQVRHPVHVAQLVPKRIDGHQIKHYDGGYFDPAVRYDFVLIDGPPAYPHNDAIVFSRIGAIELIDHLADGFVLIVDDAGRRGETLLVKMIREKLKHQRRSFKETPIIAAKQQHVFAAGEYSAAAYF